MNDLTTKLLMNDLKSIITRLSKSELKFYFSIDNFYSKKKRLSSKQYEVTYKIVKKHKKPSIDIINERDLKNRKDNSEPIP